MHFTRCMLHVYYLLPFLLLPIRCTSETSEPEQELMPSVFSKLENSPPSLRVLIPVALVAVPILVLVGVMNLFKKKKNAPATPTPAEVPEPTPECSTAEEPAPAEPAAGDLAPEEPTPAAADPAPEEPTPCEESIEPEQEAAPEATPEEPEAATEEPAAAAEEPTEPETAPEPEEAAAEPEAAPEEPPVPEETPEAQEETETSTPTVEVTSPEEARQVNVELTVMAPVVGVLKKGPYSVPDAPPKSSKTLRKQKWASQFCRVDPDLYQIFCCDKDKGKLFEAHPPVETDGKCMFFHLNNFTTVTEGEDGEKAKEFTFKVTGVNGGEENTVTFSTTSAEEREKWVKCIRRTVNRIVIDQDRVGDHTKLRKMLTGQEAEISILEEELEKMAVLAGECSARSQLAEEKLAVKEQECSELQDKLTHTYTETVSLKAQIAMLEDKVSNLSILAVDVTGESKEEVEAVRNKMKAERAERLKAIQLEIDSEEDYLGNYKKYLNLRRDSIIKKHGSTFSVNTLSTSAAPTLN